MDLTCLKLREARHRFGYIADTVDVLELVWLSVTEAVEEGSGDKDTDTLGDSEEEGRLVLDTRAVGEILSLADELP
jgi:hypothetical protein